MRLSIWVQGCWSEEVGTIHFVRGYEFKEIGPRIWVKGISSEDMDLRINLSLKKSVQRSCSDVMGSRKSV